MTPIDFFLSDPEERAIHEAGHFGMLLSIPAHRSQILFVTITDRRAAGEVCRLGPPLPVKARAKVLIAGMSAQVLACEKRNPGVDRWEAFCENLPRCETDLGVLPRLGIPDAQAFSFMEECMGELAVHWDGVERVAKELRNEGTLYYTEAEMVFRGDMARVAKYRQERLPAPAPLVWIDQAGEHKPGPWYESPRACETRVFTAKLRGQARALVDRLKFW